MKSFIIVAALFVCALFVFCDLTAAAPAAVDAAVDAAIDAAELQDEPDVLVAADEPVNVEAPSRQKRATCDLLSGAGVNHSACAAHCLLRGKRGGYCNSQAVCVCR